MKLFIDSADPKEIAECAATGLIDGVTTNPSLAAKTGLNFLESLERICALVPGSISAEVLAVDAQGMISEGERFAKVAKNVTIKVPLTWDGLKACRALSDNGHKVNVTLCFQPVQAMMAAKAGATYISPFIGRLDDAGQDGMELIREIRHIYDNYDFKTEILAASIRHVTHVRDCALAGADVATLPPAIFRALIQHPLTDKGLAAFLEDAKKAGAKLKAE
ncbi:MAG TPA: fructose-6-phosphate aldolase [Rhizomicrobium sp.]|nr:fructose-6-phosphate aldolase [Rhizomicrobium sp.]